MSAPFVRACKRYLFHFVQEHPDFRIAELKSILGIFKIQVDVPDGEPFNPFVVLELPSEECVHQIVSRSMLIRSRSLSGADLDHNKLVRPGQLVGLRSLIDDIFRASDNKDCYMTRKSVYHLWAQDRNYKELHTKLKLLSKDFLREHQQSEKTFRFTVTTFNKKLSNKQKLSRIESLPEDFANFKGKVNLENAERDYHIIENYGTKQGYPTEEPTMIYFGQWLVDGQRYRIREYHLKNRHFIANTSMDACLSMIMANMGRVEPNMFVFDPFVGSGSLLVSAAHFGGYVMGTDIDYLLLHAKAKPSRSNQKKRADDESIYSNLRQYGLEHLYLDAFVGDSSKKGMLRQQTLFDAIITDPPYGIREGAKKVGTEKEEIGPGREEVQNQRFPEKKQYHLSDIFRDLLNFAARYLHKHGRLVYWFPVSRDEYTEDNIPTHPCLRLVSNCEQELNRKVSRRLITMEMIADLTEGLDQAEVKVDHFEDSSFREKYFRQERKNSDPKSESCDSEFTSNTVRTLKGNNVSCCSNDSGEIIVDKMTELEMNYTQNDKIS